jgi:hypothetical protein
MCGDSGHTARGQLRLLSRMTAGDGGAQSALAQSPGVAALSQHS